MSILSDAVAILLIESCIFSVANDFFSNVSQLLAMACLSSISRGIATYAIERLMRVLVLTLQEKFLNTEEVRKPLPNVGELRMRAINGP
ncbi:hypothetical protein BofuT4_uP055140.1 [Botrytis cinerea T4]|uniref:Uncharacterized protein n=1 Tax=Botryotinia fuckeliana (strain T4) TaxID=999810 RepID=G2XVU3_BOTF4|nr:hypothetical protein BofuT4_uP055140.1 [Botrytis cinerea T4]